MPVKKTTKKKTTTKKTSLKKSAPKKAPSKKATSKSWLRRFWASRSKLTKVILVLYAVGFLVFGSMYAISVWFRIKHADEPIQWGTTWSFKYARELGIDPFQGFEATLRDLPISRVRIMSYWDQHEPENNQYNWEELDWQFEQAEKYDTDVSLAVGLRQPRWPECHWPGWAQELEFAEWREELKDYMAAVVERYDDHPALVEYQLENEFFLSVFGICPDHSRERLVDEYEFLNDMTDTRITISRSNNALGWPVNEPEPDDYSVSVYKRVWDVTFTKQYFEYPFPAWFYGFLGGISEITQGKQNFFIHELQAEPWGPRPTADLTAEEQLESMDPRRLESRLKYAHDTGIRTIDIWGSEWYYWQMTEFDNDTLWTTVQTELPKLD